jgi:hypothetical protein
VITSREAFAAALAAMDRPWRWGDADCCASACAAFAALHGVDPMASLRNAYAGADGARRVMDAAGGLAALAEILAARAGLAEVPVASAPAGAIGLARTGLARQEHALVLGLGGNRWAGKSPRGVCVLTMAERAWVPG